MLVRGLIKRNNSDQSIDTTSMVEAQDRVQCHLPVTQAAWWGWSAWVERATKHHSIKVTVQGKSFYGAGVAVRDTHDVRLPPLEANHTLVKPPPLPLPARGPCLAPS